MKNQINFQSGEVKVELLYTRSLNTITIVANLGNRDPKDDEAIAVVIVDYYGNACHHELVKFPNKRKISKSFKVGSTDTITIITDFGGKRVEMSKDFE